MTATPTSARPFPLDDPAWDAVRRRDRTAAGHFVFGVTTTGVYCRAGCPARQPRPEHVRLFAGPAEARAAGFRACRRCHPDDMSRVPSRLDNAQLRTVIAAIDAALADGSRPDVSRLAATLGLTPGEFRKRLEAAIGIGPRALLSGRQLARLREHLLAGDEVTDALYAAGYGSASRLYERATASLGMTPGAYRRGGAGVTIVWTTASSPLGVLLIAATDAGVCAVYLGDDEPTLTTALEAEFPRATRTRGEVRRAWVEAAVAVASGQAAEDVPLDLQGTVFQQRVWRALREIPRGQTRTYAQLATMIGQPSAVRAAARACATNKVSLLVPCHRVVGSDASLTGYRWGVQRKRRLLDMEGR